MTKASHSKKAASIDDDTDAISMLIADHKNVKHLFKTFRTLAEEGADAELKTQLVTQICDELRIHMLIEEDIFYPAVQRAVADDDLMDEAYVEHAGAMDLIEQLEAMLPEEDLYDAKVTVLGEMIEHHVKEEEGEMFPKVRKARLDLADLGDQMLMRKRTLTAEQTLSDENDAASAAEMLPKQDGQAPALAGLSGE